MTTAIGGGFLSLNKIISEINTLKENEKVILFHKMEEIRNNQENQDDGEEITIEPAFGLWKDREIAKETLRKKNDVSLIEKELERMGKEGEIILAKRNKSYVKLPETKEKIDWEKIYNEARADRV
jgi:hypothetical protein